MVGRVLRGSVAPGPRPASSRAEASTIRAEGAAFFPRRDSLRAHAGSRGGEKMLGSERVEVHKEDTMSQARSGELGA